MPSRHPGHVDLPARQVAFHAYLPSGHYIRVKASRLLTKPNHTEKKTKYATS